MLELEFVLSEQYNDKTLKFENDKRVVCLEHSLLAISKWESVHKKAFLSDREKSEEESIHYIDCMVVGEPDFDFKKYLTPKHLSKINEYLQDKQTATYFNRYKTPPSSREVVTSELIYYWMFSNRIPKECESWNINRLLTLLQVFDVKNSKGSKMNKRDIMSQNAALNAARRKQMGTKG